MVAGAQTTQTKEHKTHQARVRSGAERHGAGGGGQQGGSERD